MNTNLNENSNMEKLFEETLIMVSSTGLSPSLDRITELLNLLDNPHKDLKVIHVTGTNGKGSVSSITSEILITAGYNTGLYTSPHLVSYMERFRINGNLADISEMMDILNQVVLKAKICISKGIDFSEFEILTACGFIYFKNHNVDYVVLEVGLGGRFDATNVIEKPLVSVITNVTLDHTALLGNTPSEIAYEKSGIIKANCPCVWGGHDKSAYEVIKKEADIQNSSLYSIDGNVFIERTEHNLNFQVFCIKTDKCFYENIKIPLLGIHQGENIACAIKALELSNITVTKEQITKAIAKVKWPCRLEIVNQNPTIILDGSHNPDGIRTLAKWIVDERQNFNKVILLTAMVADKDRKSSAGLLAPLVDKVIITKPYSERAKDWESLGLCYESYGLFDISFYDDPEIALENAVISSSKFDLIVCTGSFYLVGILRGMDCFGKIW